MLGPRSLRTLARAAPRAPTVVRARARLLSTTPIRRAAESGQTPPPPPPEDFKDLPNFAASIAALGALALAAYAAVTVREGHTSAPPDKPIEEAEEEEEQPEVQAEEDKEAVEAAEDLKRDAADNSPHGLTNELSDLISKAEKALENKSQEEGTSALAAEAASQGAFNEETGEINWDCPCLGGMATGPCGEEFKAAFSCFVYSEQEPKGVDCVEKFKGMQDCFREHPEIYGEEIDDEDEAAPESDAPKEDKEAPKADKKDEKK